MLVSKPAMSINKPGLFTSRRAPTINKGAKSAYNASLSVTSAAELIFRLGMFVDKSAKSARKAGLLITKLPLPTDRTSL
jgi:hypothetical protein